MFADLVLLDTAFASGSGHAQGTAPHRDGCAGAFG